MILKAYGSDQMKSFHKEAQVMRDLSAKNSKLGGFYNTENTPVGFPNIISIKESKERGEILMESLGDNLRNLVKKRPDGAFSRTTVYKITIALVSMIRS